MLPYLIIYMIWTLQKAYLNATSYILELKEAKVRVFNAWSIATQPTG